MRGKTLQQFAPYALCRRIRQHQSALCFKLNKLVVEHIVLLVTDQRGIQGVIVIIVFIQLGNKLFHGMHNVHPGISLRYMDCI
ncbi:hypothetical protein D3C80_1884540 [compost metagenome]